MRTGHTDRIWLIGGALGAAVLLAIGWFFLIGPQKDQTGRLRDQADAAQLSLNTLHHRLDQLRQQNGDLPKYRAQLAVNRHALPQDSGMSDFLRELHATTGGGGASFHVLQVGAAVKVAGTATPVYSMPLTLQADGTIVALTRFLDQVQQVQPRAVLIKTANLVTNQQSGSRAAPVSLTLTLDVFVAPNG